MVSPWKINELLQLIRRRYPDWESFTHPNFVADEIAYKQASIQKASEWLNQPTLDHLLAEGEYETIVDHMNKLSQDNNLLWRVAPSSGDTAVLYHPHLDTPNFCTQMRNLLYGDRPSPQRLQTFSDYLRQANLPNKWPFATYFLFLCHPDTEMLVKPRTARWFLKFMHPGGPNSPNMPQTKLLITMQPSAASYAALLEQSQILYQALEPYGVRDMVDVQSFIWVCERESREQTGRLDTRGQVELDVPHTTPAPPLSYQHQPSMQPTVLRESGESGEYDGEQTAVPTLTENTPYSLAQCAEDTGYAEPDLARWLRAIHRKGQAILYGPPGTGKTFLAQKLAQHLASDRNGFWELVQFHPAYAYEEFVQGIRPFTDDHGNLHYNLTPGRFLQFCDKARRRSGLCVLVIDEINRANLASVFGELMYLMEYREAAVALAGGGRFTIPANVRLIGTMNTADRSIALVDHALRRRFAFIHLPPNYDVLRHYHAQTGFDPDRLTTVLQRLNAQIGDPHYKVGVTFFLHEDLPAQLPDIWQMEIEPYLEEYFFDQPDQVDAFRWAQIGTEIVSRKS